MLILFADDAETLEKEADNEDREETDPPTIESKNEVRLEQTAA